MNLEPPQPPTLPAPAVRPTPPTPPRIDRTPFIKNQSEEAQTPESQARDAVANGSGALTKRTVERDDENPPPNQTVTVIPPDAPLISDNQSDYDRGQDVLREFREMDAREAQSTYTPPAQSSTTEQRTPTIAKINYHEGHSGIFWVFTLLFVSIAAVVIIKKFLFVEKPSLTKSELFEESSERLKAVTDKVKPIQATKKPSRPKDDDKGKHFEVRI